MEEEKPNGAFVGLIIIIIILAVGAWYITYREHQKILQEKIEQENILKQNRAELDALQADLNTTDTNTGIDPNTIK